MLSVSYLNGGSCCGFGDFQEDAVGALQQILAKLADLLGHKETAKFKGLLSGCVPDLTNLGWCNNGSVRPDNTSGNINESTLAAISKFIDLLKDQGLLDSSKANHLKRAVHGYYNIDILGNLNGAFGSADAGIVESALPQLKTLADQLFEKVKAANNADAPPPTGTSPADEWRRKQLPTYTEAKREVYTELPGTKLSEYPYVITAYDGKASRWRVAVPTKLAPGLSGPSAADGLKEVGAIPTQPVGANIVVLPLDEYKRLIRPWYLSPTTIGVAAALAVGVGGYVIYRKA